MIYILLGSAGFPSAAAYDAWCAWFFGRLGTPCYIESCEASAWHEQREDAIEGRSDELAARAAEWLAGERAAWAEVLADAAEQAAAAPPLVSSGAAAA